MTEQVYFLVDSYDLGRALCPRALSATGGRRYYTPMLRVPASLRARQIQYVSTKQARASAVVHQLAEDGNRCGSTAGLMMRKYALMGVVVPAPPSAPIGSRACRETPAYLQCVQLLNPPRRRRRCCLMPSSEQPTRSGKAFTSSARSTSLTVT